MIHLPNLIADLGLILCAAAVIIVLFKWLKQPLVLGYLIAGFLVGPHFHLFPTVAETENISVWGEIGVIFLLFSLGLEFSFKKLLKVGPSASITAIVEVAVMLAVGYMAGKLMGWSWMDSLFLGGILSISSTTIIIRAFDELGMKGRNFVSLVFGILIVEDLVAILLMVLLSTLAVSAQFSGTQMIVSIAKLVFFLSLWFVSGIYFLPTFLRKAKKWMNDEMLLIISGALCFLMVWLATVVGFSAALGAFIMGSILAETVYAEKIEHLVKPLKDWFGAVFFVSVGMLFNPEMLLQYAGPVVVVILLTISGKLFSTTAGALVSGQPLKTAVQAGMSLAQIGEFSFIIATLGLTLKVTSEFLYPVAVAASAITTFTTPYLIRAADPLYKWLEKILPPSWLSAIHRYSSRIQYTPVSTAWQKYIRSLIINTLLLLVIGATLVILASFYLLPFIKVTLENNLLAAITGAVCTLLVMSPFLWALVMKAYRREDAELFAASAGYKSTMLLLYGLRVLLAVILIGFLLDRFFSPLVAVAGACSMIALLVLVSRRMDNVYLRLRKRFMVNYNERENTNNVNGRLHPLAPWDAHLAVFEISAEWPGAGKTLSLLALRETYGINVAIIQRGSIVINVPGRDEYIFPADAVSLIGTDEQLDNFRKAYEKEISLVRSVHKAEVELRKFIVGQDSVFAGQTIRVSGIREKTHGIVVGIERNGNRILNPASGWRIETGDTLWIVGDNLRLLSLLKSEQKL